VKLWKDSVAEVLSKKKQKNAKVDRMVDEVEGMLKKRKVVSGRTDLDAEEVQKVKTEVARKAAKVVERQFRARHEFEEAQVVVMPASKKEKKARNDITAWGSKLTALRNEAHLEESIQTALAFPGAFAESERKAQNFANHFENKK
jgi:hypothetical protein